MLRAIIEGLDYQFLDIVLALETALDEQLERFIAVGGATRNEFWMQNKADVVGRPIEVPDVEEATPLGAAILAGIGMGLFEDEEDAYDAYDVRVPPTIPIHSARRSMRSGSRSIANCIRPRGTVNHRLVPGIHNMNGKQRILAALRREIPDAVPTFEWFIDATVGQSLVGSGDILDIVEQTGPGRRQPAAELPQARFSTSRRSSTSGGSSDS